jgi:beta-aspartyl-peptidase (threonine type)
MKSLIVHGGAWQIPDVECASHIEGLRAALTAGKERVLRGESPLDVVTEVVALLEDDPTFDAGRGSVLNMDGRIEMDASIMEGGSLRAGSVLCMDDVLHPIRVARALLEDGRAVMLTGEGAARFAREMGIPPCSFEDLLIHRETRRKLGLDRLEDFEVKQPFDGTLPSLDESEESPDAGEAETGISGRLGTVGALCSDGRGGLAAATSTGGAPNTWPGRIGDSPILGAGTWAENGAGAASATGWGESILRELLAFRAVQEIDTVTIAWKRPSRGTGGASSPAPPHPIASARVTYGPVASGASRSSVARAARDAIRAFARRVGGAGGVILLGPDGAPGFAFNTPRMARGW